MSLSSASKILTWDKELDLNFRTIGFCVKCTEIAGVRRNILRARKHSTDWRVAAQTFHTTQFQNSCSMQFKVKEQHFRCLAKELVDLQSMRFSQHSGIWRRVCLYMFIKFRVDQDSAVGIATRCRLDSPGMESRGGRGVDFSHPSRPSLGPTQPHIQWLPALFRV